MYLEVLKSQQHFRTKAFIEISKSKLVLLGGRRGLEVARAHGVQAVRVRIPPILLFDREN